ncbi:MAG: hypothetical protein MUE88_09505 [Flavobacteriales bacterium]|jgi:hypothetical protein|nr:hypothetical protein [Flavobacteriales bacterium]
MENWRLLLIGAALLCWLLRIRHLQGSARWYFIGLLLACGVEAGGAWLRSQGQQNNTLYQLYSSLEIVFAALFITSSSTERWPRRWPLIGVLIYAAVLALELRTRSGLEILFSKSLLVCWALLVLACCLVLLQRSELLDPPLWRTWQFWGLLSLLTYFSLALPTIGVISEVYLRDEDLADQVFVVMDVLYVVRYSLALVAGLLLGRTFVQPQLRTT